MFCLYLYLYVHPMWFYLHSNIKVLIDCTSCLDNFDPMSAWSSTSQKGFWQIIQLKLKVDSVWLDMVWSFCLCFSISPWFMITWSIKLCSHMWHYVLSRICRNLHSDIEIDRNQRSEELLKLAGGQKIFIFREVHWGGLALWGGGRLIF